ncbi:hypothetical protein BPT24_192 [Tenacibaculum phage pT24]|uniref:Uncharacterized protein n=1 Tax=Tenacibaculum phage pT24 TaxID=1880590 RepID=A0A1B4XWZ7_9CAUD|nr:hypothetical protein HYP10_gp192 [Tenacibaculum phage pT24]BAV39317.1 hypothetical protein BPT24_192 [Tenacibaculum phage pT24]
MELKILNKVQLSKASDLKLNRMQIEESIKQLNLRNDYGFFVPIGTGKLTNYIDLDEIAFIAYNFRLIDGWITADLRASKEVYGYFIDEAILNSSDWIKERIKFIPEYDNDLIIWWNLENVHSSNKKKKEQLLDEPKKSIISNGQKMLKMNFCFLLPKNFKGSLDDAFNYFVEQYKLKSELSEINEYDDDVNVDNDHNDIIYKWANLAQKQGYRFYSESSLNEIETDENGKIMSINSL